MEFYFQLELFEVFRLPLLLHVIQEKLDQNLEIFLEVYPQAISTGQGSPKRMARPDNIHKRRIKMRKQVKIWGVLLVIVLVSSYAAALEKPVLQHIIQQFLIDFTLSGHFPIAVKILSAPTNG